MMPGKAERQFMSAIQHGQWNELAPRNRLWLLHECAICHNDWSQFTPRCQLWVLRELGRLLKEGTGDERVTVPDQGTTKAQLAGQANKKNRQELLKALKRTRLPKLVETNFKQAQELSRLCEDPNMELDTAVGLLQVGLQRHELKTRHQFERNQRLAPVLPRVSSSPAISRGIRTASPPRQLASSSSTAPLRTQTAPGGSERRPSHTVERGGGSERRPSHTVDVGAKTLKPAAVEDAAAAVIEDSSKAEQPRERRGSKDSRPPSKVRGKGTKETSDMAAAAAARKATMAPRFVESEPVEVSGTDSTYSQAVLSIVPMKSKEWRRMRAEELRRKRLAAWIQRLHDHQISQRQRLQGREYARVQVVIPPTASHISMLTKACTPFKVEISRVAELEEQVIYEVSIFCDASVMCIVDAITEMYSCAKLSNWEVLPRWPLEVVKEELSVAYPQYRFSTEDLEEIATILSETASLYGKAWEEARKMDKKDASVVLSVESSSTFLGVYLPVPEGVRRCLSEDAPEQPTAELSELMEDAQAAQEQFKRLLAPTTAWCQQEFDDSTPLDAPERSWKAPTQMTYLTPGATCFDPGLPRVELLEAKAQSLKRYYDSELPLQELLDVSRIQVVCESMETMRMSLEQMSQRLDVLWVRNGFRNPSCLGHRCIRLAIRHKPLPAAAEEDAAEQPAAEDEPAVAAEEKPGSEEDALVSTMKLPAMESSGDDAIGEVAESADDGDEDEVETNPELGDTLKAAPPVYCLVREHISEVELLLEKIEVVTQSSVAEIRASLQSKLGEYGVAPVDLDGVQAVLMRSLETTRGSVSRQAALTLAHIIRYMRRLAPSLPDHLKEHAVAVVSEAAEIARDAGVPEHEIEKSILWSQLSEEEVTKSEARLRSEAASAEQARRMQAEAEKKVVVTNEFL
jgi:hypothetical protein